jgi:hypothetical protein
MPSSNANDPQTEETSATNSSKLIERDVPFTEAQIPSGQTVIILWKTMLQYGRQGLLAIVILTSGTVGIAKVYSPTSSSQLPVQQIVSRADYERLTVGMSLTDAQANLGRAIEVGSNETTATYKWENSDGSMITAVFKGDRLISKQQSNLK